MSVDFGDPINSRLAAFWCNKTTRRSPYYGGRTGWVCSPKTRSWKP